MAMSIDYAFQSYFILAGNLLFLDQQSMRSPKVQAKTTAASLPLGSSSPQSRSWIVSQVPWTRRADVPIAETAFLLMLTRTCSCYMATVVKPQPLDQLHADKESHDFGQRGDLQASVCLLAFEDLSAGQVHDEPGPGGDHGVSGVCEFGQVGLATDGASGAVILLESEELGGSFAFLRQFQETQPIHYPKENNNLIQFMLISKLLFPRRLFSSFTQRIQPLLENPSPEAQQEIQALWKKEIESLQKLQSQVKKQKASLQTHLQELRSDSQKKLDILKKNLDNAIQEKALLEPRMAKELQNAKSFALTKFAKQLIDVADNLRLFNDSIDKQNLNPLFRQHVKATSEAMFETLALYGIKPIESDNQPFDPNFHQAVVEIPSPSDDKQGLVVTTTQRGYVLKGRVLRSAKVIVYQKL